MRDSRTAMDLNNQPPFALVFAARARHRGHAPEGFAHLGQPPVFLTAPGGFERLGAKGAAVALGCTLCDRARALTTEVTESRPAIARIPALHPLPARVSPPFPDAQPGSRIVRERMAAGPGLMALGLRAGQGIARQRLNRRKWLPKAVSLGDADSLNRVRRHFGLDTPMTDDAGEGLIRLPIGLYAPRPLLADPSTTQEEV